MFEDIKIGDIVYIKIRVPYSFGKHKSFQLPATVERVTKTQFIVTGKRYKKDTGIPIGGSWLDKALPGGVDEYEEMRMFERLVKIATYINHFEIKKRLHPEHKNLLKIYNHITAIKKLMEDE